MTRCNCSAPGSTPATWQRIRLRFARRRILDLDEKALSLGDSHSRPSIPFGMRWRGALAR